MKVYKDILNQTQAKTLIVAGWKNLLRICYKKLLFLDVFDLWMS